MAKVDMRGIELLCLLLILIVFTASQNNRHKNGQGNFVSAFHNTASKSLIRTKPPLLTSSSSSQQQGHSSSRSAFLAIPTHSRSRKLSHSDTALASQPTTSSGTTVDTAPRKNKNKPKNNTNKNNTPKNGKNLQANNSNNNNNNNNPQELKPKKAPLVDSTLLRFLSAQKNNNVVQPSQQQQQQQQQEDELDLDNNTYGITNGAASVTEEGGIKSRLRLSNEMEIKKEPENGVTSTTNITITTSFNKEDDDDDEQQQQQQRRKDEDDNTPKDDGLSKVQNTDADSLAWFTQFNSHRIAQKLIAMGVNNDEAYQAGNSVQTYVLARTTRQRIRTFLRDRDNVWASSSMNGSSNGGSDSPNGASSSSEKPIEISSLYDHAAMFGHTFSIDDAIEVLIDAGLTGKDIAAIFTHSPSVSMTRARKTQGALEEVGIRSEGEITLEDILDRAYFGLLCKTLKLRKYDARKVLRTCPGLLTKSGSKSAGEVISILSSLNVSAASLSRDKASLPILLSRSPASLFRLIAFLSGDGVRMPVSRIGPFIRRSNCEGLLDKVAPIRRLLPKNAEEEMEANGGTLDVLPAEFILNEGDFGVEEIVKETYKKMHRTAKFLRRDLGIRDLGKVLSANPDILTLDVEETIIPLVDFLYDDIGMDDEEVPAVLVAFPQLLNTDIKQMNKVIEYFKELEVSEEILPSIFRAFPALLTLDVETKMVGVVEFLKSIGVTNIGRFITRLPPVLGYSVKDDLQPKWDYLTKNCQYATFEVIRFPAYFSYPMERVIKTRYEYLRNRKNIPVQLIPVDDVMRYGDKEFATLIAGDFDGKAFANFVKLRRMNKTKRRNHSNKKMKMKKKKINANNNTETTNGIGRNKISRVGR